MTIMKSKNNEPAATSALFNITMELLAAFIAKEIKKNAPLANLEWKFDLSDGTFRRREEWGAYGFLNFKLPDKRSGTIVAGIGGTSLPRYAFDGSLKVLAENVESRDLPNVTDHLVDDLMAQLGLTKRSRL